MRTIQRKIVGAFIFSNDGYVVLGKSTKGGVYQGHLTPPGGGIDEGESLEDAVKREVLEEVSLDISNAHLELVNDTQEGESEKVLRDSGERVIVRMQFFDFKVTLPYPAEQISVRAQDDFDDARWIPINELPNLTLTEPTKDTLRKLGYL